MNRAVPSLGPTRRELHLTPAGRIFLPVACAGLLGGWLAGGTSGMFAALAFALFALAPVTALLHVRGLRVEPPGAARIPVGDPFHVLPRLTNASAFFTARDVLLFGGDMRGGPMRAGGILRCLAPGRSEVVPVVHRLLRRGRERELRLVVSSFHPLGLVEVRLSFLLPVDFLGLPRLGTLGDLGVLPGGRAETSAARRMPVPGEEEFHAVRDWREGESLRRVHWRLSARRGRLIQREYQVPVEAPVHLLLLTGVPSEGLADELRRGFETAVSLVATLAEHYLRRGRRVRLTVVGARPAALPCARGRGGLSNILTLLAEVESAPRPAGTEARGEGLALTLAAAHRRGEVTIVVHAGDPAAPADGAARLVLGSADRRTTRLFLRGRPTSAGSPLSPIRP